MSRALRWLQEKWRRFNADENGYEKYNTDDVLVIFWLAVGCATMLFGAYWK
jgi:hypothetical protein